MNTVYKAIGFDWSGVVFFYPASYPQAIQDFFGIEKADFQKVYYQYNHLLNTAGTDPHEVWTKILSHFGKESEATAFEAYLNDLPEGKIHQDMIDLIHELKEKGYKVGLLSNHTISGAQHARSFDIEDLFDTVLFSAEIGFMKPQREAFAMLAEKLDIQMSELIYIDDAQKSLEGASDIGYTPILYKDMTQLRSELQKLL